MVVEHELEGRTVYQIVRPHAARAADHVTADGKACDPAVGHNLDRRQDFRTDGDPVFIERHALT